MNQQYANKINNVFVELNFFENKINNLFNNNFSTAIGSSLEIKAFKNYALITVYGCLENIFKNIISDYYKNVNMPIRCQQFAAKLLDSKFTLSVKKESLKKFLKENCSYQWYDELNRRENVNSKDKKTNNFDFGSMYLAIDIIFSERCKFAHGESSYQGTIGELKSNFNRAVSFLYEIDDIISMPNLKG